MFAGEYLFGGSGATSDLTPDKTGANNSAQLPQASMGEFSFIKYIKYYDGKIISDP